MQQGPLMGSIAKRFLNVILLISFMKEGSIYDFSQLVLPMAFTTCFATCFGEPLSFSPVFDRQVLSGWHVCILFIVFALFTSRRSLKDIGSAIKGPKEHQWCNDRYHVCLRYASSGKYTSF